MKTLGLLMLDTAFPRLPGDVGHLASWRLPVLARVVPGAGPRQVVQAGDPALLQPFIDAARALAAQGVAAITTSCGFLVRWQAELQAAVPVPVWTSALLKLPELDRPGVITVDAASLGAPELRAAGGPVDTPVEGLLPGGPLQRTLLENLAHLDGVAAEAEVLAAVHRLLQRNPAITALVLECTNLPPHAAAIERATGLPVHHLMTLVHERFVRLESHR
jgi:hypothetical protein